MPDRVIIAYAIVAFMAAAALGLFLHLSREWRADRRSYRRGERSRRAKARARRVAARDALRPKS
ncbi:MAG TPA: hypothetical protein VGF77_02665 [Allosphingosinicella sp.]|jgi:hypothetical protein